MTSAVTVNPLTSRRSDSAPLNSAPISTQPATDFHVGISTPEFRRDDATLKYDVTLRQAATSIPILTLAAPSLANRISFCCFLFVSTVVHPRCLCSYRGGWEYCSGGGGRLIAWGGSIANLYGDAKEVILLQEGRRRGRKVSFCAVDLTVAIKRQSYRSYRLRNRID